jgi:ribonuclease HII
MARVSGIDHGRGRESTLWAQGVLHVAGTDEAGVGPLCGPIVAAAVILPRDARLPAVDDSKKLTEKMRSALFDEIREIAVAWHIAEVGPEEIDAINIYHAGLLAMRRALEALDPRPGHALVDGRTVGGLFCPETRIVGGDAQEPCIAAASVLAKVHRDRVMQQLDAAYPGYGLARHKGYPTSEHRSAIASLGPTSMHRLSYRAVQELAGGLGPLFSDPTERDPTTWRRALRSRGR